MLLAEMEVDFCITGGNKGLGYESARGLKVTEGFIYADPVAEIEPDIDTASRIVRLLLE